MSKEKQKAIVVACATAVVAILLFFSILLFLQKCGIATDVSKDNLLTGGTEIITLRSQAESAPISLSHMLPGDSVTKTYAVEIKNDGTLAISFHVLLTSTPNAFSDALCLKVCRSDGEQTVYEGPIRDMPAFLRIERIFGEKEIPLSVTVYLPSTATNECAEKAAEYTFGFSVREGDLLQTGDFPLCRAPWPTVLGICGVACAISLLWLVVFLRTRRAKGGR